MNRALENTFRRKWNRDSLDCLPSHFPSANSPSSTLATGHNLVYFDGFKLHQFLNTPSLIRHSFKVSDKLWIPFILLYLNMDRNNSGIDQYSFLRLPYHHLPPEILWNIVFHVFQSTFYVEENNLSFAEVLSCLWMDGYMRKTILDVLRTSFQIIRVVIDCDGKLSASYATNPRLVW